MSLFDLKNADFVNISNTINYDFITTTIYKSEIQNPDTKSGAPYRINFINSNPEPNFIYVDNGSMNKYKPEELYIYPLLHNNIIGLTDNNQNINIIGEMVIQLTSSSNDVIYMCFLLENSNEDKGTDVDLFISLLNSENDIQETVNLNNSIPKQDKVIVYNSSLNNVSNKVFLFTKTIKINKETASFIEGITEKTKNLLFNVDAPTKYVIINTHTNNKTNTISEANDNQIYIDCNLTGESDETIQTYNVPINSEFSEEQGELNFMKSSVNFIMFFIGMIFCYTIIPFVYKYAVIDKINKFVSLSLKTKKNKSVDILIAIVTIVTAFIFLIYGYKTNNYKYKMVTIVFAVIYLLSFAIIQIKKKDVDYFMSTVVSKEGERKIEYFKFEDDDNIVIDDIINACYLFISWIGIIFQKKEALIVGVLFYILIFLFSYYIFGIVDKKHMWDYMIGGSLFTTLIMSTFIAITYKPKE
jgi:hypothetical protein